LKPIEGYYLETVEGFLFAVKGLDHPEDGVVAYLRYIPDERGERVRGGQRYRRVYDLQETTNYLRENHPQYLRWVERVRLTLQFVPLNRTTRVYNPRERLRKILKRPMGEIQEILEGFVKALVEESVPLEDIGLTGSMLIGLSTEKSDIDLVVYGRESGLKAYESLKRLREKGILSEFTFREALKVAEERWCGTGLDLEVMAEVERSKLLHGLVDEIPYFVRLVPNPWEVEPLDKSNPLEVMKVRGVILDDRDAIYTPCLYQVEAEAGGKRIERLMSYRGRFTEQVWRGEEFEARGTLEEVHSSRGIYYRLMMGGRKDYLISLRRVAAT
jgi:hypothetical protein